MRQTLLDHGLRDEVAADREDVARLPKRIAERSSTAARRRPRPHARLRSATSTKSCAAFRPEHVFAQTLLGFETIQASTDAESNLGRHQLRHA